MLRVFEALPADSRRNVFLADLAQRLRVEASALKALDTRPDPCSGAAAFPMRDAANVIRGIRYRDPATGDKWSLRGGRDGLFSVVGFAGSGDVPHGELIVCEGASDTAAALSLGLVAVGRSSCGSGTELLRESCRRHRVRFATIVADADTPGLLGAKRLGRDLAIRYRVVTPPAPYKDLRAWYDGGALMIQGFRSHAHEFRWE